MAKNSSRQEYVTARNFLHFILHFDGTTPENSTYVKELKRAIRAYENEPVSEKRIIDDDGMTLEVNRCCTDGTRNACSMLYGAAQRAAKALGYKHIITYTRQSENGASLRASNWIYDGPAGGTHWTGQRYEQTELVLDEMKVRWRKEL